MKFTDEMKEAIRLISETDEHVYITGKAGTGKTTLLKHIVNHIGNKNVLLQRLPEWLLSMPVEQHYTVYFGCHLNHIL